MAKYLIGDVQGCDAALGQLLQKIGFSTSQDTVFLLGDLVNRGPDSLAVLRRIQALGSAAQCILGNHDLHALAVATGVRRAHRSDTLTALLNAKDSAMLLDWLRYRPLALWDAAENLLMVHAGVLPQWSATDVMVVSSELSMALRQKNYIRWLEHMYGNSPAQWSDQLTGHDRLRVVVNALTRMRFCSADGTMEFSTKEGSGSAPEGYMPWFEVPGRLTADVTVAFGHWSTLGLINRPDAIALDTGCVWGGCLSAMRIDGGRRELVQIQCTQAQAPG